MDKPFPNGIKFGARIQGKFNFFQLLVRQIRGVQHCDPFSRFELRLHRRIQNTKVLFPLDLQKIKRFRKADAGCG